MKQYHELLQRVLDEGTQKEDRTGTGTISVFGHQMRFKMEDGFPCLTTKKTASKIHHTRITVVFKWRYKCTLFTRKWRSYMERMG